MTIVYIQCKINIPHYVCSYTWSFSQRLPIKENNRKHFIKTKLPFMSKYINCSKHTLFQVTSFCSFLKHKSDTFIKWQVYMKRLQSIYVCTRRVKLTTSPVNRSALRDLYPQSNGIVLFTQHKTILFYHTQVLTDYYLTLNIVASMSGMCQPIQDCIVWNQKHPDKSKGPAKTCH